MSTQDEPFIFGSKTITCQYCKRTLPQKYCKRHNNKTKITVSRYSLAAGDELSKEVAKFELAVSQAYRTGKFGKADSAKADFLAYLADREQSIKEQAENDLLYELYYAAEHNSLVEKLILEKIEARGLTRHHVVPSALHSTNNSLEEK